MVPVSSGNNTFQKVASLRRKRGLEDGKKLSIGGPTQHVPKWKDKQTNTIFFGHGHFVALSQKIVSREPIILFYHFIFWWFLHIARPLESKKSLLLKIDFNETSSPYWTPVMRRNLSSSADKLVWTVTKSSYICKTKAIKAIINPPNENVSWISISRPLCLEN